MYEKILKLAQAYVILASRKIQPYPISEEERAQIYGIAEDAVNSLITIKPENRREGLEFFQASMAVGNIEIPIVFVLSSGFNAFYDKDNNFIQLNIDRKELNEDNLLFQMTLTLVHEYTHVFQGGLSFNNFLYSVIRQYIDFSQSEKDFDRVDAFNDLEEFVAKEYSDHLQQFKQYRRAIVELPLTELENLKNKMYDTSPDEREAQENELLERIRYNKLWEFGYEYIQSGYKKLRLLQLVESYAIAAQLDLTKQQIVRIAEQILIDLEDYKVIEKLEDQIGKDTRSSSQSFTEHHAAE